MFDTPGAISCGIFSAAWHSTACDLSDAAVSILRILLSLRYMACQFLVDFRGRKSVGSLCAGFESVVRVLERNATKYTAPLHSPAYSAPPPPRPSVSLSRPNPIWVPLLVYSD